MFVKFKTELHIVNNIKFQHILGIKNKEQLLFYNY